MSDAAGDATEQQGSPRGQGPPRVQSTAETRRQPRRHRPAGLSLPAVCQMRRETRQSSRGARGGKARLGCNQPRKRGGDPAGFGLRGCRCLRYVRCGGRRDRAAGEPEGARPASGAINRGNAETTPQASACGVVAVCGMLDAAGSPAAQMKCCIIRSARSGYRKNRPASHRTCGAVLCNVRFRLRAALISSAM